MEWGYWVAEPDFPCTYYPSEDRFDDFKVPDYMTDSTGRYLGIKEEDEDNLTEDAPEPTRYPELVLERLQEVDENGHHFLRVLLYFELEDRSNDWEFYHTSRKIWLKRVYEGRETRITSEEKARVAADDSGPECQYCPHQQNEREGSEEEHSPAV